MMVSEQTPHQVLEIRKRLYDLTSKCIPVHIIMKILYDELSFSCDGSLKHELSQLAAEYEHKSRLGQKPVYHIEAFVIKFMCVYKQFLQEGFEAMSF